MKTDHARNLALEHSNLCFSRALPRSRAERRQADNAGIRSVDTWTPDELGYAKRLCRDDQLLRSLRAVCKAHGAE